MVKPMIDMEMDDETAGEVAMPMPMPRQTYPYGLRICLSASEMEKLGLDPADAVIDGYLHLHALARITSVSSSNGPMGAETRVELQIEKMCCLESEDEENEEAERKMPKKAALYTHDRS